MGALRSGEHTRSHRLNLAIIEQNYRSVLRNPFAYVCFGVVVVEGICIHGSLPFIGEYLMQLGAGGVQEAGFVISAMAFGGLAFASSVPLLLRMMRRPPMMALGGCVAAVGLAGLALGLDWPIDAAFIGIIGFGFFCLHNPVQTEVFELAPAVRASAFSLHAFSFYVGQAAGPVLYGTGLHAIGLPASFIIAAASLLITGVTAYSLFRRAYQTVVG